MAESIFSAQLVLYKCSSFHLCPISTTTAWHSSFCHKNFAYPHNCLPTSISPWVSFLLPALCIFGWFHAQRRISFFLVLVSHLGNNLILSNLFIFKLLGTRYWKDLLFLKVNQTKPKKILTNYPSDSLVSPNSFISNPHNISKNTWHS